ncbi:Protein TSSC1 [Eufriesea mexicana]|uniref:Protein TSSC1 n=1 Tax=Eufriesea mexicana TaxID=516756 RepID=A0A310SJF1_9HYME|nr:Protein TSSC1 [Eufriesea mexicana]
MNFGTTIAFLVHVSDIALSKVIRNARFGTIRGNNPNFRDARNTTHVQHRVKFKASSEILEALAGSSNCNTRALSAQIAETDIVRFLVGTQSLKFNNNQVHLVELNEETGGLKTQVFHHHIGEIWSLQASPTDPSVFITCYNTLRDDGSCHMKGALWKLPELKEYTNDIENLKNIANIDTTPYGTDLKTIAYHPMDSTKAVSVATTSGTLASKGQPRFTNGKWNPHNGCNQFVTLNENNVRGWDFRNPAEASWTILSAHSQIISDSRVILCSIASISSEPFGHIVPPEDDCTQNEYNCKKDKLEDGVVGRYEEHEDSVYAVEWSSADPWTFASLSYDGRLVLNKVPRKYKYQILL